MNVFRDQESFMKSCGQTVDGYNEKQFALYVDLITEETTELTEAIAANDKIEVLDALIDILVVAVGALHSMGADAEGAWREVMATNFAKVDKETGLVRKREDGKILKPLLWVAPDLAPFLSK